MVNINGYEIKSAFSGGEPLKAIYSLGEKVWPVDQPVEFGGLKFTALEDGKIGMEHNGTNATTTKPKLSYSKDGVNWTEWNFTNISVNTGDVVYFKGVNKRISYSQDHYSEFTSTGKIYASGNIMSLLYGDDYEGKLNLSGKDGCFNRLFYNCSNLTNAPELPATELEYECYNEMFYGCTSLTTAPELPATTLAKYCYGYMFYHCTSLTIAPELPATTLENGCYESMFSNCTSLTNAPELPATTLTKRCYSYMFAGCTNLNYVKANFTTTPSTTYTASWLSGVASTGTFVANPSATWTTSVERNETTVPAGWTIQK